MHHSCFTMHQFLLDLCVFVALIYHSLRNMCKLITHIIYYAYCAKLQNHFLGPGKPIINTCGKSIVPHAIIRVEFTLPSMLVEALFQLVVFIARKHSQSQHRISRQAFEESRSLYEFGDTTSWYSIVVSWLLANVLDINWMCGYKISRLLK